MMGPRRLAGGLALSLTVCLLTLVWVYKSHPVLPPPDPEHQSFLGPECLRTAHESHDCAPTRGAHGHFSVPNDCLFGSAMQCSLSLSSSEGTRMHAPLSQARP